MKTIGLYKQVLFIISILLVQTLFSETVLLKNGDKITGELISADGDKVIIKTQYSEMKINKKDIKKIVYDEKQTKSQKKNGTTGELDERMQFTLSKLRPYQYEEAQNLNLDVHNYRTLFYNRRRKKTANILTGIGIPVMLAGVAASVSFGILYDKEPGSIYYNDYNYNETKDAYFYGTFIGGFAGAAGFVLTIIGAVKHSNSKTPVYKKDGSRLSFSPVIGKNQGGVRLAYRF